MILFLLLASAQAVDCANAGTTFEERHCAGLAFERADAELNRQWRSNLRLMQKVDRSRGKPEDGGPSYTEALRASQRAWLLFRDKHCELDSFVYREGTFRPVLLNRCLELLTKERTKQLRDVVGDFADVL